MLANRGTPERENWIDEEILVVDGAIIAIGGGGAQTRTHSSEEASSFTLTASFPNGTIQRR